MTIESEPPGQCTECGEFAVIENGAGSRVCMDCGAVLEEGTHQEGEQ